MRERPSLPKLTFLLAFTLSITSIMTCGLREKGKTKNNPISLVSPEQKDLIQDVRQSVTYQKLNDNDEYAVLSVVTDQFLKQYSSRIAVINWLTTGLELSPVRGIPALPSNMPDLEDLHREEMEDFKKGNSSKYILLRRLVIKGEYHLVKDEIEKIDAEIRSGEDGWKSFFIRYPQSSGLISFSRVGFNQSRTKALVYAAKQKSLNDGVGLLIYLRKERGIWHIYKKSPLWVS